MHSEPTPAPRALRIGIFIALLPPEHLGGAELQADRLARELAARGHAVHVFARRQPGRAADEVRAGVRVHRRRVVPLPGLRPLVDVVRAALQAQPHRLDVLLCFMTFNNGVVGWLASRLSGAPFVIWQRIEAEGFSGEGRWQRAVALFLNRRARLWVQSATFAQRLAEAYAGAGRAREWPAIAARLRILGNGLDVPPLPAASPRQPPPRRFLFIGRLTPQKDVPTLLAALRLVPEAELWVVGAGERARDLEAQARGLAVRFLGPQPHDRVLALLGECRALVLPSRQEGIPNVVLEALAHGTPVIATPVGAIPELIQDGVQGRLVPVGDVEALAAALRDAQDDGRWRKWAAAAPAAVQRFDWPRLVADVESELGRLVDEAAAAEASGRWAGARRMP